jgi:hypothetical protein
VQHLRGSKAYVWVWLYRDAFVFQAERSISAAPPSIVQKVCRDPEQVGSSFGGCEGGS